MPFSGSVKRRVFLFFLIPLLYCRFIVHVFVLLTTFVQHWSVARLTQESESALFLRHLSFDYDFTLAFKEQHGTIP
jgi:hypothetical protein